MPAARTRPVAEGLFRQEGGETRLIGSRCRGCGALYFPQAPSCRNPSCLDKRVEAELLPARGILYSYTVQAYRPPPLFRDDAWQPYAIGLVEIAEGLRVMGMLSGCPLDAIRIGMPVRLATRGLYEESGAMVETYIFVPAGQDEGLR